MSSVDAPKLVAEIQELASQFRTPNDAELNEGIAELAKHVGKKAASSPTWTKRLAVSTADGAPCLVITGCLPAHEGSPWVDLPFSLLPVPRSCPLAEGVALLASADNPEATLERRRQLIADHEAEVRRLDEARRQQAIEAQQRQQEEHQARETFHADTWRALTDDRRFKLRLAIAVEKDQPAMASAIRSLVAEEIANSRAAEQTGEPRLAFPRCDWWSACSIYVGKVAA